MAAQPAEGVHPRALHLGPPAGVLAPDVRVRDRRAVAGDHHLASVRVPGQCLIHGGCVVGSKIANLIYFEDNQTGLIAIPWSATTGETKYARFSTQMMPRAGRGSPSLN